MGEAKNEGENEKMKRREKERLIKREYEEITRTYITRRWGIKQNDKEEKKDIVSLCMYVRLFVSQSVPTCVVCMCVCVCVCACFCIFILGTE